MKTNFSIKRRGLMLVLSSPSGAGKTSISRHILKNDPNIVLSVSATTRKRRAGEVSGVDYHFVSLDEFNQMAENKDFLEYAKVFDHYYGTPRSPVEHALSEGKDILFDIDWQGTQQLSQSARSDLVTIFILPPSWDELQNRLMLRAQDSEENIIKRMNKAGDEMSHWPEYDYVLINADFETSVSQVKAILTTERLRRQRQLGLPEFVKKLRQKI